MSKSVSATDLAKMTFCEASVTRKAHLRPVDLLRMNKGKAEHRRFERSLHSALGANSENKVRSGTNSKGDDRPTLLTIHTALTSQGDNSKISLLNVFLATLIIAGTLTFYLTLAN